MSGILWICTLSVVLVLIQWQSMNAYAGFSLQSFNSNTSSFSLQSVNSNTSIPTCEILKTPPGAIKKNWSSCMNTYGSKCVFTCKAGYRMNREQGQAINVTRTCLQSGKWSGNSINCTAVTCKPLETPPGAIVKNGTCCNNTYGLTYVFTCKAGFRMKREEGQGRNVTRTCLQSGNWSGNSINCTAVTCQPLETPPGAIVKNGTCCNNTYGLTYVFTCKVGFAMNAEKGQARDVTRTCSESGQWSGNSINCTEGGTAATDPSESEKILLPITAVLGSLLLFILIVLAIHCLLTRLRSNARTRIFDTYTEEIMEQDNLAYRQPTILQGDELEMKVMVSQQSDAGFNKSHIYHGGHCQILDNANGRPGSFYTEPLDSNGATGTQSEIENELNLPEFSAQGCSNRERVLDESERVSQFQPISTVKVDTIGRKTGRKIATVFASRPDPRSDLIYLRFYVYSDNEDSKMRVELTEKERFPDSKPAREQPFRMYNDSKLITVKLTDLEEGWEFDKTNDTQIYLYDEASGNGARSACDFAVKPEEGRDVKGFSCIVRFQLEADRKEYSIYLNPGFAPLKRQSIRQKPAACGQSVTSSSNNNAIADCSTTTMPAEEEEDCDSHNREGRSLPDSSRDNGYVQCDHFFTSLGLGNDQPVTENLLNGISPYVGVNWKPVLRKLSIEDAIIKNLEEDLKNAPVYEKCYQGLLAWKGFQGPKGATIKTLCNALRFVGCSEALKALQREMAP